MKWFYNLKIGAKLIISFLIVAALAAAVGIVGIVNIKTIDKADELLYEESTLGLDYAGNAALYYQSIRVNFLKILEFKDTGQRNASIDELQSCVASVDDYLKKYEEGIISQEDRELFAVLKPEWEKYKLLKDEVVKYLQAGQDEQASAVVYGQIATTGESLQATFKKLMVYNSSTAEARAAENTILTDKATQNMTLILIIAIVAATCLGFFISRIISKPIIKMVDVANKLAQGDIDVSVEIHSNDEVGILAKSFVDVIENVREQVVVAEKIAVGDLGIKIEAKSDKDALNIQLREMLNTIQSLIAEMNNLSEAAAEGNLSVRGDVNKFQGDYQKIVSGVNDTLDETTGPIHEAVTVLEQLAKGDLQVSMVGEYKGDHAIIKKVINRTLDALNEVMRNINLASEQVASGARQVSESSMILSQGATEQASSIEELTASLEEIASQTKLNAQNANQANELGGEIEADAEHGNTQMVAMLTAMEEISESSNSISKIIKVIDDIAFQTNILALNAAVEAARAGQHGKGFAVVAEEVRNLAAKSADAAKETTEMIETSIKKAEGGTKIANETANALTEIIEDLAKSTSLVSDISVASNEQALGIEQVNQAIMQVSQVVQTNSATSEEGAAASEELSSQAVLLRESVNQFKLRTDKQAQSKQSENPGALKTPNQDQTKVAQEPKVDAYDEAAASKEKIALSDTEFGKY
jgi:methyl-accepting chemotaxis protein